MTVRSDEWRDLLRSVGVPDAELDRADDEELLLLTIDYALAGDQKYTADDVAGLAGVDGEFARRLYRALGVPDAERGIPSFGDEDVDVMGIVARLRTGTGIDDEVVLQLARVIGSSLNRVSEAQVSAAVERVRSGGPLFDGFDLEEFPRILTLIWRRQMRMAARRRMALHAEEMPRIAVGFADLVGFTALSQQLDEAELAQVVDRFEALAYDVVGLHGGRVVKMIGDEVMFAVDDVRAALECALALSESYRDDDALSDVRVGLAAGPVLEREGDLYGPTVNLASRIVSIAFAGSVVVDGEVHDACQDEGAFEWRSLRTRHLKDIGRVALWVVRRTDDGFENEGAWERARRRRGLARNRVAELLSTRERDSTTGS